VPEPRSRTRRGRACFAGDELGYGSGDEPVLDHQGNPSCNRRVKHAPPANSGVRTGRGVPAADGVPAKSGTRCCCCDARGVCGTPSECAAGASTKVCSASSIGASELGKSIGGDDMARAGCGQGVPANAT
jgi:hypothetical protein